MHAIHPVFHVSQLEPSHPNMIPNRHETLPTPVTINGEPEFEINDILDSKIDNRRCACKLLYLVRWAGYEGTDEETTWLLASELDHAKELVMDFHQRYPGKPGDEPVGPWYSTFHICMAVSNWVAGSRQQATHLGIHVKCYDSKGMPP